MHMDSTQDSSSTPKKPNGRPPLKVTEDRRAEVAELAKLGMPQDQIAFLLRISVRSLRKHFRDELYDSAIKANHEILKKLYELALNGNPAAATFWARTRCKFRAGGSPLLEDTPEPDPPARNSELELEFPNNDGAPREDC